MLVVDFEGETSGDWETTGEAFGQGPARGTLPNQMQVSGLEGQGLVNSFFQDDATTGTLTLPPRKTERRSLNFLIGGGMHPGRTCINLLVDGQAVHTATGPNDKPGGRRATGVGFLILGEPLRYDPCRTHGPAPFDSPAPDGKLSLVPESHFSYYDHWDGQTLMSAPNAPHHVYLSYVQSDGPHAQRFREILEGLGIAVSSCRESTATEDVQAQAKAALSQCSVVVVLIGPQTQGSRWVDMEIALGIQPRIGQPGAGLVGIILQDHADFAQPYYESDRIPLRLHDRTRWEYAIIRKWSEDPRVIEQWLSDADRRRYHFCSAANISTIRALREFQWNDSIDTPRPVLQALAEQE